MKNLSIIILLLFLGCQKEKQGEPLTKLVIRTYSMEVPYLLGSSSNWDGDVFLDTIKTSHHTKTIYIHASTFKYVVGVSNLNRCPTDSLYIEASANGKTVKQGFKFISGDCKLNIQLSGLQ